MKEGVWGAPKKPQNFKESKISKGLLCYGVICEKDLDGTWEKIKHAHQYGVNGGRLDSFS